MAGSLIGAWRPGSDAHYLWEGADWNSFNAKWKELSGQGYRLTSITTAGEGAQRTWSGVWRAGTDGYYLWVGVSWSDFQAKWNELSKDGLRLVDIKPYLEGNEVLWAGVWRAGTDGHYLWSDDWSSFNAKWQELSKDGLRLTRIDTFMDSGTRRWVGVWRAGTGGHYLWVGVNWTDFVAKWEELAKDGLRLVDVATYVENGERKFAGVWRAGTDGYELWWGKDIESFLGQWNQQASAGMRLVSLEAIDAPCAGDCCNHVCSIATDGSPAPYVYGVTGDPGGPYRWPVDDQRYARVSALLFADQPFTLPFKDTAVKHHGTWIYRAPPAGNYHHAIDFSRDDTATFEVVAAAAGRIAFVGWDDWSGNTVIVSHDVGGGTDNFRTIYMHMRNGPGHDIDAAWNNTVPTLNDDPQKQDFTKTNYEKYLNGTGAAQDAAKRNPDANFWGTDAHKIVVSAGQHVSAGDELGWAGCTGPGGCGCTKGMPGAPNTHLHVFWCRKDSDGNWYFIDPYGIYSYPAAGYPAGVTDKATGPCVRYSVAWKGGQPQYP
jgi:murein DD-endopeptidase MepM/ murein hydrolase activator NlpD